METREDRDMEEILPGRAAEAMRAAEEMAILVVVLETMETMEIMGTTTTMEIREDRLAIDSSEVVLVRDSSLLCLLE